MLARTMGSNASPQTLQIEEQEQLRHGAEAWLIFVTITSVSVTWCDVPTSD